ncbi:hypothetical protein D3C85_1599400 [compost metagenome]
MIQSHVDGSIHIEITTNDSQPYNVPTVPGLTGDSPEPKPSAMARAGWPSMKRAVGRVTRAVCPASSVTGGTGSRGAAPGG